MTPSETINLRLTEFETLLKFPRGGSLDQLEQQISQIESSLLKLKFAIKKHPSMFPHIHKRAASKKQVMNPIG